MDPRAGIGDPGAGGPRRGYDHDPGRSIESVPQVSGGDPPGVGRQIHERVDQRPAGALLHELPDQAVRVDPVRGAQIGHAEYRLVGKQPRCIQHSRVGGFEGGALRERVSRIVVRHAGELGTTSGPRGHERHSARRRTAATVITRIFRSRPSDQFSM